MKQHYLILLAFMIIVVPLFLRFSSQIIADKIDRIDKYDEEIKVEQEKLNSAKVLNDQLSQVSRVIKASITADKKFDTDEIGPFTKQLEDIAEKYKFPIVNYSHKDISAIGGSSLEHLYTMELNCTFVQLGKFLTDMEALDSIIKIKTLNVTPYQSRGKSGMMDVGTDTLYKIAIELSTFKIIKEA